MAAPVGMLVLGSGCPWRMNRAAAMGMAPRAPATVEANVAVIGDRTAVAVTRSGGTTAEAGMVYVVEGAGKWRTCGVGSGGSGGGAAEGLTRTGWSAGGGGPLPGGAAPLAHIPGAVPVLFPIVLAPKDIGE